MDDDDFVSRFERMTVKTMSPDMTVSASYSVLTGIRVALDDRAIARHTESSLAHQVQLAVSGINEGFSSGTQRLIGDDDPGRAEDETHRKRREEYAHRVMATQTRRESPLGYVRVKLRGTGRLSVAIREGIFSTGQVTTSALESEIDAALAAALSDIGAQRKVAYREAYEPSAHQTKGHR